MLLVDVHTHLHLSLKSINYGPLTGRKTTTVVRKQEKRGEKAKKLRQALLEMRRVGRSLIICKEVK